MNPLQTGVARAITIIILAACHAEPKSPLVAPAAIQPTWRHYPVAQLPLTFRLPPGYTKLDAPGYDCWTGGTGRYGVGPGTRDICVSLIPATDANSPDFQMSSSASSSVWKWGRCRADCMRFSDVHTDTTALGEHRAIVIRARGSGGQPGYNYEPMYSVRLFLQRDSVAYVEGMYGDAADLAELLAIMSTISPRQ